MNETRRQQYLSAMGIDVWVRRSLPQAGEVALSGGSGQTASSSAQFAATPDPAIESRANEAWRGLEAQVRQCTACELHQRRTQAVPGVGNRRAQWLVIGEAPGADEDRQGEPFVGKAGKLLNNMLLAIGLKRDEVYITNVVKCRPPQNRDPRPEEAAACADYLRRQIALIEPRVILVVGRIAAQNLLNTTTSIGRLRGQVHRYADTDIPLLVTYHPAYLLRSPLEKRKAWQDLQHAVSVFRQTQDRFDS